MTAVLVVGVGNDLRGDDAAGLEVARRLRGEHGLAVALHEGDGAALLELWNGAGAVVLVDAVRSGAPAGTIHRFDATSQPLPATVAPGSTHVLGLADAIELARVLGRLPGRAIVYGVEGSAFELGSGLSGPVAAALEALASAARAEALALAAA